MNEEELTEKLNTEKDIVEAFNNGFQKGKLEEIKKELSKIEELRRKIRMLLIENSESKDVLMTTKYGDISDVCFWEYEKQLLDKIEQLQKEIKVSGDSLTEFWDNPEDDRWDKEEEKQDDTK